MKLDATATAVKRLVILGRGRGYVTVDEVNTALPSETVSAEMIEDVLAMLSDEGLNVVDGDDGAEDAEDVPWNPEGPLSPSSLQSGAEAPLDAEAPFWPDFFNDVTGRARR